MSVAAHHHEGWCPRIALAYVTKCEVPESTSDTRSMAVDDTSQLGLRAHSPILELKFDEEKGGRIRENAKASVKGLSVAWM